MALQRCPLPEARHGSYGVARPRRRSPAAAPNFWKFLRSSRACLGLIYCICCATLSGLNPFMLVPVHIGLLPPYATYTTTNYTLFGVIPVRLHSDVY